MAVLLIALIPAALVFISAVLWESRPILFIVAMIAIGVGVATGHPGYMTLDVVAALVGWFLGNSYIKTMVDPQRRRLREAERTAAPQPSENKDDSTQIIVIVVVLIGLAMNFLPKKKEEPFRITPYAAPAPVVQAPPTQVIAPTPATQPTPPAAVQEKIVKKHVARKPVKQAGPTDEEIREATMQSLRENCHPPICEVVQ